jgi:molybdopterin/thiamine biosynthesis adenylyltransferase
VPQADVVLDCCDNFATRQAVNAPACGMASRWCRARPSGWTGRSAVYDTRSPGIALLRLRVPAHRCRSKKPAAPPWGCLRPLVGIIGSLQAAEALKLLTGAGTP